jgi:hypothetical protein
MSDQLLRTINLAGTDDPPPEICEGCLVQSMQHIDSGTLIVFCHHTLTGGWKIPGRAWDMSHGFTFHQFRTGLTVLLAELDYQACGGDQRADSGMH